MLLCWLSTCSEFAYVQYNYFFLGVSYRKGLNLEHQSTGKEAMLLAAVDEEALTRSVRLLSDRSPYVDIVNNTMNEFFI